MTCKHECFIGNSSTGQVSCANCRKPKAECDAEGLQLIEWKQNWSGGALSMGGVTLDKADQVEPIIHIHRNAAKVGEGTITGTRSEVGSDEDHGHTYRWTAFDFNVRLDPIGYSVNIRSLIRQGFQVYAKLRQEKADEPATN